MKLPIEEVFTEDVKEVIFNKLSELGIAKDAVVFESSLPVDGYDMPMCSINNRTVYIASSNGYDFKTHGSRLYFVVEHLAPPTSELLYDYIDCYETINDAMDSVINIMKNGYTVEQD